MSAEDKVREYREFTSSERFIPSTGTIKADAAIVALEAEVEALKVGGTCRWWQSRSDADGCYLCCHPDVDILAPVWCGPGCKCPLDPSRWTPRAAHGGGE